MGGDPLTVDDILEMADIVGQQAASAMQKIIGQDAAMDLNMHKHILCDGSFRRTGRLRRDQMGGIAGFQRHDCHGMLGKVRMIGNAGRSRQREQGIGTFR